MRKLVIGLVASAMMLLGIPAAHATDYTLTVTVVGSGLVTDGDGNITCGTTGSDCTSVYSNVPSAKTVVLTEDPDDGFHFDHWNGSVCENDTTVTCTITMSNTRSITATFVADGGGGGTDPLVVIAMENHTRSSVAGAPFLSAFADDGIDFTNFTAVTHPSLPNYFALTAGSTLGCTNDGCPKTQSSNNIFNQLGTGQWINYAESMPTACSKRDSGLYAARHNPAVYFTNLVGDCKAQDLKYPLSGAIPTPLAPFTFVTPNNCSNMHGTKAGGVCPKNTQQIIDDGDAWLQTEVGRFQAADPNVTIVIWWDEGVGTNQTIYVAAVGPGITPNTVDNTAYNHYNLTAAIEDWFSLSRLNNAVGKTALPIA